jgi:hypothetical protein
MINALAFMFLFRIIGGGFDSKTDFPRWLPVTIVIVLIAMNNPPVQALAMIWAFVAIRLLATKPLLGAANGDFFGALEQGLIKIGWLAPSIFTYMYLGVDGLQTTLTFFVWWFQGVIYFISGKIANKFPKIQRVMLAECVCGFIFGLGV